MTQHEDQGASAVSIDPSLFQEKFDELAAELAPLFARREPRAHAAAYVRGLLADLPRKNCWTLSEQAGAALSTRSGATLKDTMVRAGQSSEKAALIYQHSDDERQQEVAAGLDATVRKARQEEQKQAQEAAAVPDEDTGDPDDQRSGTNLARDH